METGSKPSVLAIRRNRFLELAKQHRGKADRTPNAELAEGHRKLAEGYDQAAQMLADLDRYPTTSLPALPSTRQ